MSDKVKVKLAGHDRVVEVEGHFGLKKVTKQQFINAWTEHVRELRRIDYSDSWMEEVDVMKSKVEWKAGQEFEKLYKRQSGE